MTRKEILLQNTAKAIVAHFLINGEPEAEIVSLFGTHILPTSRIACRTTDDADTFRKEIAKLNPGYCVSWI
jgi:hypothetical protein